MAIFAPGTGLLSGYTEGSFAAVLVQEENCRLPMCRNIEAVALLRYSQGVQPSSVKDLSHACTKAFIDTGINGSGGQLK